MTQCRDVSDTNANLSMWNASNHLKESSLLYETTRKGNPKDTLPLEAVKLTLYTTCALFGIIGNVLVAVILTKLRGKKMHVVDFYLINLAIADLCALLLAFPIAATRQSAPLNWPFGEFVCLYVQPFTEIFTGASVWCIALTAFERYQKIAKPVKVHVKRSTALKKAKNVAACTWVVSFFVFSFPLYFVSRYTKEPNKGALCGPAWPSWDCDAVLARVYIAFTTVMLYILPLVVISWTFLAVSRQLNESSKFIKLMKYQRENETANLTRHNCCINKTHAVRLVQNRRAKRILIPVIVVFAVFMLPMAMLRFCLVVWPLVSVQPFYNNWLFVALLFAIINSSSNPVIYSVVRRNFRLELVRIFCWYRRHPKLFSLSQAFISIDLGVYRFNNRFQMENSSAL